MVHEIHLKVAEAIQDDTYKGVVRIDTSFMKELNLNQGDVIEIEGERKTVALVDRNYPGDIGLGFIRMDGLLRRNARIGLGESVTVRKANPVKEAKKVVLAPAKKGIVVKASPNTFKRSLIGRAILKGDVISLGGVKRRRTTMSDNPLFNEFFSEPESISSFFADLRFIVASTDSKTPLIIGDNTEIILNPEAIDIEEDLVPDVTYEDIGGLDDELKKVREMVELPLKHPEIFERLGIEPPKGVLMHGPPGTGKTLLAKAVANETNAHFILINGPEIMSKFHGQSEENLRKKFEEASKNAPSIIFIDEIDAIATKREESHGEVEKRVVAQLLGLMDGLQSRGKVIVIAASNIPNSLDPALRRPGRFDRELEIGVPGIEGRKKILQIHTRNMPLAKKVDLNEIAEITHGFVGADLAALSKEAAMVVLRKVFPDIQSKEEDEPIPKEVLDKLIISQEDFVEALKVVRPSALREVLIEKPNIKWEDVGGLEVIRQELIEAVEWPLKHPDAFKRMGVKPPKGILLYGPPGTGKTLLAKAVATETKANFISVKGPELLSKWVGESEKAIREIFKKARQTSPTIIFFDEIDSIASNRNANSNSKVTEQVVNQLLTEMDGLEDLNDVVVIAATNRPDMIDSALLRPGRFDRVLLSSIPNKESREKIFGVHIKNMPLTEEVKIKKLADKTEGYVGADIEAICREAAILALREDINSSKVSMKHFDKAMEKVHPSVNKDIEEAYENLEKQFKMKKGNELKEQTVNYMG